MWEGEKDSAVVVVSFMEEQAVFLDLDTLDVLIIGVFSEDVKCHLRGFPQPV